MANLKYEVIKRITSWDVNSIETIEFNIMKWGNNPPKYDIRKWENGTPRKGVTLSDEMLDELFHAIGNELGYKTDNLSNSEYIEGYNQGLEDGLAEEYSDGYTAGKNDGMERGSNDKQNGEEFDDSFEFDEPITDEDDEYNKGYQTGYWEGCKSYRDGYTRGYVIGYKEGYDHEIEDNNVKAFIDDAIACSEEEIDFRDFFVYGNAMGCSNPQHNYKEHVRARVGKVNKFGTVSDSEFDAVFCPDCGVYYMSQAEYEKASRYGRLLCQVMSDKEYSDYKNSYSGDDRLNPENILHRYGYNVGEKDGFSESYRQIILKSAIENGVISVDGAINHLGFLIRLNEKNTNQRKAIEKWKRDRAYLQGIDPDEYMKGKRVIGIKRIIR